MTTLHASIYSPRWGHDDKYEVKLGRDEMVITFLGKQAKCVWMEGRDPVWQGESLDSMLRHDSIYAPAILPDLFEYLWHSWRSEGLSDENAQRELVALVDWLNLSTKSKPKTDFWKTRF